MRTWLSILGWLAAGVVGIVLLVWGYPRAFPFVWAQSWSVSRDAAQSIAEAGFLELGDPVVDAYMVTRVQVRNDLLGRMRLEGVDPGDEAVRGSRLGRRLAEWETIVYGPGAGPLEWTYRATVSLDGEVTSLRKRLAPEAPADGRVARQEATDRAAAFLAARGLDLVSYEEPEIRVREQPARTDLVLRFVDRERVLGPEFPYGAEVVFAGDTLLGSSFWFEDPRPREVAELQQPPGLVAGFQFVLIYLLLPVIGVLFLRRYHAGEVGVKRGVQVFLVAIGAGLVALVLVAKGGSQGFNLGVLSRVQVTWVWGIQLLVVMFLPIALTGLFAWSVGEVHARRRWSQKLAGFDALFQGAWRNATVARGAVLGPLAGLALAGLLAGLLVFIQRWGAWPMVEEMTGWWTSSRWAGLALLASAIPFALHQELFGRLFLLSAVANRFGVVAGAVAAVVFSALVFFPFVGVLPTAWGLALWLVACAVLVGLFLAYDLLTVVLASVTAQVLLGAYPLLAAQDPWLQFQGILAVGLPLVPAAVSLRDLGSGKEFEYRYEDVPPHVRRIAHRERQRLELETARRIQGSILPALPRQIEGVELAYAYQPATEVGGDFYDVVRLADGRLALALGDVAGHGVSSGLIMAALKSAFEVQVRYDPRPEAVFANLNRLVLAAAGKRLLATLAYGLLDPAARALSYASAGHLFPYRIGSRGAIEPLESISYPLGVREEIRVKVRETSLEASDLLVFFSDGIVEARRPDSDQVFGFERVEEALAECAGRAPEEVRDRLLGAVTAFAGDGGSDDDLTLLVVRIP